MKTYSLSELTIRESDIKPMTHCEPCGNKLRTTAEKMDQVCEECQVSFAKIFEEELYKVGVA